MPAAVRPDGAFGKLERLVRAGVPMMVFADDAVGDATTVVVPLDACGALAGAAEAEAFLRSTALVRYLNKGVVNDDALLREGNRAVAENYPDQACTCFAFSSSDTGLQSLP
jgi:hypothetical protein